MQLYVFRISHTLIVRNWQTQIDISLLPVNTRNYFLRLLVVTLKIRVDERRFWSKKKTFKELGLFECGSDVMYRKFPYQGYKLLTGCNYNCSVYMYVSGIKIDEN